MNSPQPDARATARPSGLIDTIQAGFTAVNRHAWLLILPLVIDVGLWIGPQFTAEPLAERWLMQLAPPPGASSELAQAMDEERRTLLQVIRREPGATSNNEFAMLVVPVIQNLALLVIAPLIGLPSFRAMATLPGEGPRIPLADAGLVLVAVVLSTAVGLCLSSAFYGMLGQAIREGRTTPTEFAGAFPPILAWTTGFFVLMWSFVLAVGTPIAMLIVVAGSAAPMVGAVLVPILLGVLLWAFVYLFFTTDAIFVSRVSPITAIRLSIRVVRHNFWSTVALISLIFVIGTGLSVLWKEIAENLRAPGSAVAILGHIYITSGLAAASMTYYKERLERLTEGAV